MHWTLDVTINIMNSDLELKAIEMAELRRKYCWAEHSNVIKKIFDVFLKPPVKSF